MTTLRISLLVLIKVSITVAVAFASGISLAQINPVTTQPALSAMPTPPTGTPIRVQNAGAPTWLDIREGKIFFLTQWNPVTGQTVNIDIPPNFGLNGVANTSNGLFLFGEKTGLAGQVALQMGDKGWSLANLLVARERPRLLVMRDQSLLIYSGNLGRPASDEVVWSMAVERVSLERGRLVVERIPDLPGPVRRSFAMVSLADGRVMALGGTAPPYIGCMPCYAETYLLDTSLKRWVEGPRLLEARSDASATLLPDGRVMVAGGWTPVHDWSRGPTRSVEIWHPNGSKFEPAKPLPSASAMHIVNWAPGQTGRQLLLGGGNNASLQLYDLATDHWRVVGEDCVGAQKGGVIFYPFVRDGQLYRWISAEDGGICRTRDSEDTRLTASKIRRSWSLSRLRVAPAEGAPPPRIQDRVGIALYRAGLALAPPTGDFPALAIGGSIHSGMNAYEYSAAVDAIWPDGRIQALPAMNQARSGAHAMTFKDGSRLVLGGQFGHRNDRDTDRPALEAEWLPGDVPLDKARWLSLDGVAALKEAASVGQAADGSLAILNGGQTVRLVSVRGNASTPGSRPLIEVHELPPLERARDGMVALKGSANGKLVVAGGRVQVHKIAMWHEAVDQPDAADEYIGIGEYLPSRRHEVFDPVAKVWRTSAPSRIAGENAVILNDGRVMKVGKVKLQPRGAENETQEEMVVELSSVDGTSWAQAGKNLEPQIRDAKFFELQGEVFLTAQGSRNNTGGGTSILQWFNRDEMRWEGVWEAGSNENWRAHVGRIVVRVLANGKRVVVPVGGY